MGVFATFSESGGKGCLATRLAVVAGEVSEIETIVARKGEASVLNPDALQLPNPIFDQPNSGVRGPSSDEIRQTADAYFNALQHDSSHYVTFAPGCQRIENGVQTTSSPHMGNLTISEQIGRQTFLYISELRERRFPLIDAERGLVLAMAFLDVPGVASMEVDGVVREMPPHARKPRSTLLFELFKVVEGPRIAWIEAMMVNLPSGTTSGWA